MAAAEHSCVGNSHNPFHTIVAESKAIAAAQRTQVHDVQAGIPYHSVVGAVSGSKRPAGDLGKVLRYRIEVDGIGLRTRSTEASEVLHRVALPQEGVRCRLAGSSLSDDL